MGWTMTLHDDIKRMGDLCRSCGDGGSRTIYSAGVQLMSLFLEREEELLKAADLQTFIAAISNHHQKTVIGAVRNRHQKAMADARPLKSPSEGGP